MSADFTKRTLKFSIKQDGTVVEEVIGEKSNNCLDLTKIIEEELGTVESRDYKPEYYEQQTNVTLQHNQNEN
tara:strand:+ start:407 stop:622 length:216 start_codon:yes stop_codon:yes gene_type:complete